ncbi:aminoglycoside phosphotransferase family protein [Frondihabitans sucicola]|uniref:aminoglycoside phosphotransferase family protein n=1 Tax=Frondihabitans sucicola TaxID=1268041 RepID=UPI0025735A65|nr:aminoglycoside phosphotransferase family protein [Frondihabitans sucicola]
MDEVVRELNARREIPWALGERLDGGSQSGAWDLTSADGSQGVLKVATTTDWSRQVIRAVPVVAAVRRAGYPTPAWLASGTTVSGTGYQVQQRVPGASIDSIDLNRAHALIDVLEQQQGLDPDPDRCWSDFLIAERTAGKHSLRVAAQATGHDGRRLLGLCERLTRDADRIDWPRTDLVHGDFRPANVLFDRGLISGVIDIEAIGSGPRAFDYATLLSHLSIESDALALLVAAGCASSRPAVLRACVGHVFLDLVRFMSRNPEIGARERAERARALGDRAEIIDGLTAD